MMADQLTLDDYMAEMKSLEAKYSAMDFKNANDKHAILEACAREFRIAATKYVHAGILAGFTLDVNGTDASLHVLSWPEHALEREEIDVVLMHHMAANIPTLPGTKNAAQAQIAPRQLPPPTKAQLNGPPGSLKVPS